MDKKKRGGWSNPASKENGLKAQNQGRPRKLTALYNGKEAAILRHGDLVAVHDANGINEATIDLTGGVLWIVNADGQSFAIMLAD